MSRRAIVVISVAAVAAGGILGSALAMQGPAKLSLSASAGHRHQMHSTGMMGSHSMSMHSHNNMPMGMRRHSMRSNGMMAGATFTTLDNQGDPTFNQLLGINNRGQIAGYFGSGAAGHPNKGYLLTLQHGMSSFQNENFPGSVQTQVTGLNDHGVTVGFWSSQNTANMMNNNFGFYAMGGVFHTVNFPSRSSMATQANQLLGVNDFGLAVGFYTNAAGANRGYTYNIYTHRFSRVLVPGAPRHGKGPSLTAAAINNHGDIAGFYDAGGGMTDAFLKTAMGTFIKLAYPGAAMTQAFGVNDRDEVVGAYTKGTGNNAMTYGFTWTPRRGFTVVNAPQGMGATTINGVNNAGALVGFYTDMAGNTHGLLVSAMRRHMPMQMMPTATPSMMPSMAPSMAPSMTPSMAPMPTPTGTSAGNHF